MKRKISPPTPPPKFFWSSLVPSLLLAIIPAITVPVEAAEKLIINYEGASISVELDSLEQFAKGGQVEEESLNLVLNRMKPTEQAELRKALQLQENINPIQLNRFLHTPIGEEILTQVGKVINLPGSQNGKYAIRSAAYRAARNQDGLSLINFLRQFSTDVELNAKNLATIADCVSNLIAETETITAKIQKLSSAEAAADSNVNFANLRDLRTPGSLGYSKQTITLNDTSRQRQFKVDLYRPQQWRDGQTPVVIASHGLASSPKHFQKQAQHLASYGYLVAVPQHPGSDNKQFQDLLSGYSQEIFKLNEFIDRPLDVTYLLNELEKHNHSLYQGRLNLNEVGVIGHSFGGYTALALAGAQINFEQLEIDCGQKIWAPNLSLLLQCRALDLEKKTYNFRDSRIKAILAINPVNASLFGQQGLSKIQIPVFLVAGTEDPATPALTEQIRSFTWLNAKDKYLTLVEGLSHGDMSLLEAEIGALLKSIPALQQRQPDLFESYGKAMVTAFFQSYLPHNADYLPYLQASYANYISESPFNIYLLQSSSSDALKQSLPDFRAKR